MSNLDFFSLWVLHPLLYVGCLIMSFCFYYYIMKKTTSSWLNPMRISLFVTSMGITVLFFLFFLDKITLLSFLYCIGSNFLFWLSYFLLCNKKKWNIRIKIRNETFYATFLFFLFYILTVLLTIFTYVKFGIPLFSESRLATYEGSGLGFIGRLLPFFTTYCYFFIFHIFLTPSPLFKKFFYFTLSLLLIVFGVLSGSRSSFITLIYVFWGYNFFYKRKEPKLSNYKIFLFIFLGLSLITFSLQYGSNVGYAFLKLGERVVASGDVYWQALPDDTWKGVEIANSWKHTFMGFLGPLRILDASLDDVQIGFQLTELTHPSLVGIKAGPVVPFSVFGLVCFGYIGGLILSMLQGMIASLLLSRVGRIQSNSLLVCFAAYYLFTYFLSFLGGTKNALAVFFDIGLSFFFLVVVLLFIGFIRFIIYYPHVDNSRYSYV